MFPCPTLKLSMHYVPPFLCPFELWPLPSSSFLSSYALPLVSFRSISCKTVCSRNHIFLFLTACHNHCIQSGLCGSAVKIRINIITFQTCNKIYLSQCCYTIVGNGFVTFEANFSKVLEVVRLAIRIAVFFVKRRACEILLSPTQSRTCTRHPNALHTYTHHTYLRRAPCM